MFKIYKVLKDKKPDGIDEELILFPTGVTNLPPITSTTSYVREAWLNSLQEHFSEKLKESGNTCLSMVIYPKLSKDWKSDHEGLTNVEHVNQYIEQLEKVVRWLNAAEVSHNDLLPRNILWSVDKTTNKLSIRVIDFEDATFFGDSLKSAPYDLRYPFYQGHCKEPSAEANNFFLKYVTEFIKQREVFRFRLFMEKIDSEREERKENENMEKHDTGK